MINFDEEIKKFHPSMEIEELNDRDYKEDSTDMVDVLREMYHDLENNKSETGGR